jgi:hypothetical protein
MRRWLLIYRIDSDLTLAERQELLNFVTQQNDFGG